MQTTHKQIIALDVGTKRVGVAHTNTLARLPSPLTTLIRGETFWKELEKLLSENGADVIVVGLPRNLDGNDTDQTRLTRDFMAELATHTSLPLVAQDEALTSHKAETELQARGKKFEKGDIDALAASYILQDYLDTYREVSA